jgi:hypothetical protein
MGFPFQPLDEGKFTSPTAQFTIVVIIFYPAGRYSAGQQGALSRFLIAGIKLFDITKGYL